MNVSSRGFVTLEAASRALQGRAGRRHIVSEISASSFLFASRSVAPIGRG
jgi:hypothetical protein